jgi:carbon-monoxide dehydrogenase medium subunit/2-furoyl-CoA dehydrogenase FAD binding subunit
MALTTDGLIDRIRLVFAGAKPLLSVNAGALRGQKPNPKLFSEAANAAAAELDAESDIHASADYRREVSVALARRVLEAASDRATDQPRQ